MLQTCTDENVKSIKHWTRAGASIWIDYEDCLFGNGPSRVTHLSLSLNHGVCFATNTNTVQFVELNLFSPLLLFWYSFNSSKKNKNIYM